MPYNTRRVSLSLPSLGIQLPGSNSASRANRSPSNANAANSPSPAASSSTSSTSAPSPAPSPKTIGADGNEAPSQAVQSPPAKRVKRSHGQSASISVPLSSTKPTSLGSRHRHSASASGERPRSARKNAENTPPPSPGDAHNHSKIDYEGIKDDIVVGVLQQLELTGNRPHLIKEMAAILMHQLSSVESSANPTAIISSRLTNYLKRPWTALAPCPLTKEQVATHPRRVYYYLTTAPRQAIPEFTASTPTVSSSRLVSPSISSGADDEEDSSERIAKRLAKQHFNDYDEDDVSNERDEEMIDRDHERERMSPSPELDLSSHQYFPDHVAAAEFSFSSHPFAPHTSSSEHAAHKAAHHRRGASPALENDEREFSQTATVMQQLREDEQRRSAAASRASSSRASSASSSPDLTSSASGSASTSSEDLLDEILPMEDESEASVAQRNSEAAAALFGHNNDHLLHSSAAGAHTGAASSTANSGIPDFSSPVLRPLSSALAMSSVPRPLKRQLVMAVDAEKNDTVMGGTEAASPLASKKATAVFDVYDVWGDMKSPECVALADLDDLFSEL